LLNCVVLQFYEVILLKQVIIFVHCKYVASSFGVHVRNKLLKFWIRRIEKFYYGSEDSLVFDDIIGEQHRDPPPSSL